jgi:uncharacterized sulfatase
MRPAPGQLVDGQDLSAALLGKEQATRARPLFWLRPPDRPGPPDDPFPDLAVRDGDWKLLINEDGSKPQLYDLAADPRERTNLADQNPDVLARLRKMLLDWRQSLPVERPTSKAQGARVDVQDDAG